MTSRAHKRLVPVLIVLASLVGTVAVFAVWLDRQVFNTDEWTHTSDRLLENGKVRAAVANYEVDVLYANVDVTGEVAQLLPARAQPLAGAAASGLRLVIAQASRALGTPLALDA